MISTLSRACPLCHVRYRASDRSFQEATESYHYSDRFVVRRTQRYGQFSFHGRTYRVSEAFSEDSIALAPTAGDGLWDVYYCRYRIGKLNERTRTIERHQPLD